MGSHHVVINCGRIDLTGGSVECDLTDSAGNLGTRAVVDGKRQRHTGVIGALGKTAFKNVAGLLGQRGNVTQKDNAHIFALKQRQLVDERLGKQMHQNVDLMLRTVPVFGRKRIGRKHVDAQTHAGGNNLAKGDDTRLVALGACETARRGPTTVTVHDARDMVRNVIEVKVGKTDARRGVGKVLDQFMLVVLHLRSP